MVAAERDQFVMVVCVSSVVDLPDPKDRMIRVVQWYLSAFHAGRKVNRLS